LGNVFIISLRALFRTPSSWRQRRPCVAIIETAKRRRNIFVESDQLATFSKLHPN
jgi:hypothetical protein